jgi:hypothetical protein
MVGRTACVLLTHPECKPPRPQPVQLLECPAGDSPRTTQASGAAILTLAMGSLIKKRRKRMRKKKHKKMLKRTRWQRRAAGK